MLGDAAAGARSVEKLLKFFDPVGVSTGQNDFGYHLRDRGGDVGQEDRGPGLRGRGGGGEGRGETIVRDSATENNLTFSFLVGVFDEARNVKARAPPRARTIEPIGVICGV